MKKILMVINFLFVSVSLSNRNNIDKKIEETVKNGNYKFIITSTDTRDNSK